MTHEHKFIDDGGTSCVCGRSIWEELEAANRARTEAERERDDWKRMADAADNERVETYGRWRSEREGLKAERDAALKELQELRGKIDGAATL